MAEDEKPDFSAAPTIPFRFPRQPKDDQDLRLMVFTEVMRRVMPHDRGTRKRVRQMMKALPKELPDALAAIGKPAPEFQAQIVFNDVLQWVADINEETTGESWYVSWKGTA
jgi:hypothetical protein